ncbi:MAG: hypothetical protein ABJA37_14715 [Ferruginibacter sp.]
MKNLFISALRCSEKSFAIKYTVIRNAALCFCFTTFTAFLLNSCKKFEPKYPDADIINMYKGLSKQTILELQQARAATERYRDLENAIADGYSNINVDVPNMGHHFMKTSLVDDTFDIRKPEILVYNGLATGHPELVAVEYAIPLTSPMPEGFTGANDVWNSTSGFPLWLVHAWVWKYNPDGVFNWTNPSVELH